jgi:hypothetical protein
MKIMANELTVGTVMASGEIVRAVNSQRYGGRNHTVLVTLLNPKTNKTRLATWAYFGTIFVKDSEILPVDKPAT